jgi:hypothetical protein
MEREDCFNGKRRLFQWGIGALPDKQTLFSPDAVFHVNALKKENIA